ncbi:MAG: Hsp20/alpha crystallin family protein [Bacteroidales bacterium]|nr:Hsp20/alpha crystallin family protein [Bacteroidales bacterium]
MRLVKYNNYPQAFFNEFNNCEKESFSPEYKVLNEENDYNVVISVPGYQKEDFVIKVEKNLLIISSEINEESEAKDWKQAFRKSFEQRFRLSEKVENEKIEASYNNGILEIRIPKKEEEAVVSRQIQIA